MNFQCLLIWNQIIQWKEKVMRILKFLRLKREMPFTVVFCVTGDYGKLSPFVTFKRKTMPTGYCNFNESKRLDNTRVTCYMVLDSLVEDKMGHSFNLDSTKSHLTDVQKLLLIRDDSQNYSSLWIFLLINLTKIYLRILWKDQVSYFHERRKHEKKFLN